MMLTAIRASIGIGGEDETAPRQIARIWALMSSQGRGHRQHCSCAWLWCGRRRGVVVWQRSRSGDTGNAAPYRTRTSGACIARYTICRPCRNSGSRTCPARDIWNLACPVGMVLCNRESRKGVPQFYFTCMVVDRGWRVVSNAVEYVGRYNCVLLRICEYVSVYVRARVSVCVCECIIGY